MEGVAEIDESHHLFGCTGIDGAAMVVGVIGHDTDGIPMQAGETDHQRFSTARAYFEK